MPKTKMSLPPVLESHYLRIGLTAIVLVAGLSFYATGSPGLAKAIWAISSIIGAIPILIDLIHEIRAGEFGVDVIAITTIVAALLMGEYLVAIVILLMVNSGEALEEYAQSRAKHELSALLAAAPVLAHLQRGSGYADIPVAEIQPGDIIEIRPGELVPVDCTLMEGDSSFDEAALTGESLPVDKTIGDDLLSGSVNTTGLIVAKARHTSGDSQYEHIISLVQTASSSRSPMVRLADQYSLPFTIVSFGLAGLAWIISGQPVRALEVLVVATPCPLLLATPVAIVSGMSRAARYGIIVKGGGALEQLSRVQAIAFDKTGTLTRGLPKIAGVQAFGLTEGEVLALAAALEQDSVHVLAATIVQEAQARKLQIKEATDLQEEAGDGLTALVGRQHVAVGKLELMTRLGIHIPHEVRIRPVTEQKTEVMVARGKELIGIITFADQIRSETPATLHALKRLGIKHLMMLSGDRVEVAERIAHELGLHEAKGGLLPEDKVKAIAQLGSMYSPVAMVGDGVNDAPTLAAADVGIALGAKGSTAATESADVVIMLDDLRRVPAAVSIARRAVHIARQSIFIGIGLSVFLMLVAMTGRISPVYGAILQECIDVAVIINALRAHTGTLPINLNRRIASAG